MYDSINMRDEHHARGRGRTIMKQMIFFNQLPRYIHITKKEMSGTLHLGDMNGEK